jgi:hypothetical protein
MGRTVEELSSTALTKTQPVSHTTPTLLSQSLIRRREARQVKPDYHAQWKLMRVISGHLGWVRALAVEPGNQWFASGAGDRVVKVRVTSQCIQYCLQPQTLMLCLKKMLDLGFGKRRAQAFTDRPYLNGQRVGGVAEAPVFVLVCRRQDGEVLGS